MSTNTQETLVEKVRSILDRANHPNTPQAEAETALALAQRLITKYNLDESALAKARGTEEAIVRDKIDVVGIHSLRRLAVLGAIARRNSCAVYRTNKTEEVRDKKYGFTYWKKTGYTLHIFGTEADIFATKVLWASAEALALRSLPKGDKSFRHSWWLGFEDGISRALHKANKEAVEESGGNSLVLVERGRRADQEMRAQVKLRSVGARTGARRYDAYNAGRTTGASFSPNGVNRGAIGALNA